MSKIKIIDQELRLEMMEMLKEVFNEVMVEAGTSIKKDDTETPVFPAEKLFKGAPLMQMDLNTRGNSEPKWNLEYFKYNNARHCYNMELADEERVSDFWECTRLPTAEESPRNIWLIPHTDLTKNIFTYCSTVLVRYSSNDVRVEHYIDNTIEFLNNPNIEAIMMVSKLK